MHNNVCSMDDSTTQKTECINQEKRASEKQYCTSTTYSPSIYQMRHKIKLKYQIVKMVEAMVSEITFTSYCALLRDSTAYQSILTAGHSIRHYRLFYKCSVQLHNSKLISYILHHVCYTPYSKIHSRMLLMKATRYCRPNDDDEDDDGSVMLAIHSNEESIKSCFNTLV